MCTLQHVTRSRVPERDGARVAKPCCSLGAVPIEALDLLRESHERIAHIEVRDTVSQFAVVYLPMGHAHLLLGQLDEAEKLADRVVKSYSPRLGLVPHACQLLGDIATRRDESDATASEAH
jgi:hypothetical protein